MVRIHGISPFAPTYFRPLATSRPLTPRRVLARGPAGFDFGTDVEAIVHRFLRGGPTATGTEKQEPEPTNTETAPAVEPIAWAPRISLSESKTAYELRAELPGVAASDVEITVDRDILTISGRRVRSMSGSGQEDGESTLEVRGDELNHGRFERRVRLPEQLLVDAAQATLRDGLLSLRLPKQPEPEPIRIAIAP